MSPSRLRQLSSIPCTTCRIKHSFLYIKTDNLLDDGYWDFYKCSFIFVVLTGFRLHLLDYFHCGYLSSLQVVQAAKGRGTWLPTATRPAKCSPATRCGYYPPRRETASLPTRYISGTAASSTSGTTACPDGNTSAGLYSTTTTRRKSEISTMTPAAWQTLPMLCKCRNICRL